MSFCGCGFIYVENPLEKQSFENAANALIEALDNNDRDEVYSLFSPAVREENKELMNDVEELLRVYRGPTAEIGWDGLTGSETHYEYGDKEASVSSAFPVRAADAYYWFYFDVMFENTVDENRIGITSLCLCTEDEYCLSRDDEYWKYPEETGIVIFADRETDEEIRCISGTPYFYSADTPELSLDRVKSFFEDSDSFSAFKDSFGKPNCQWEYGYKCYDLPKEDGKLRFLQLEVDDDIIYFASVVDEFVHVETVYDDGE